MASINYNHVKFVCRDLLIFRKTLVIVLAPLILLPLLFTENKNTASTCAYVVILMAMYWITEALPLAVTSFIPVFLFPFLGVMPVGRTCGNYLKDVNFLFLGGLIMAVATEESNLHKRIALRVLITMGSQPRWLMFGFMITTAFLSMWMSNTATTAMMLPIVAAVLEELIKHFLSENEMAKETSPLKENGLESQLVTMETTRDEKEPLFDHLTVDTHGQLKSIEENLQDDANFPELARYQMETVEVGVQTELSPSHLEKQSQENKIPEFHHLPKHIQGICKSFLLCICISANLGGTGTLTGTGPNLVFSGQLQQFFPNQTEITFASWLAFGIPTMAICLILAWVWLQIFFMGFNFAEASVLFWFTFLVFLWVFREPLFIPGWVQWFHMKPGFTSDSCAAMFVACILFVWPNQVPDFICWRKDPSKKPVKRSSLMTWTAMQHKFPWSIIVLLGGGFAMADGVQYSGLAKWLGCHMQNVLGDLKPAIVMFVFLCLITGITEIASNSATASIFIPILLSLSQALQVNPLYMTLPATVAASFAFMLPVATPPNAIVYECKMIKIKEMMMVGLVMNIICIAVTAFNVNTMASAIFGLSTYPQWALSSTKNVTCL